LDYFVRLWTNNFDYFCEIIHQSSSMEELLFTAIPTKNYTTLILLISAIVLLLSFLYLIQNRKIKGINGAYRQIGLLLGGLLALIAFATTLFTAWNLHTIQPVKLYESYMESYHGKTPYKQIKRAGIFNDQEKSLINSQVVIRDDHILVVEKRDKRVMLFAEENYDLKKLTKQIQQQMKASKGIDKIKNPE